MAVGGVNQMEKAGTSWGLELMTDTSRSLKLSFFCLALFVTPIWSAFLPPGNDLSGWAAARGGEMTQGYIHSLQMSMQSTFPHLSLMDIQSS
jgi:hypothetical protein